MADLCPIAPDWAQAANLYDDIELTGETLPQVVFAAVASNQKLAYQKMKASDEWKHVRTAFNWCHGPNHIWLFVQQHLDKPLLQHLPRQYNYSDNSNYISNYMSCGIHPYAFADLEKQTTGAFRIQLVPKTEKLTENLKEYFKQHHFEKVAESELNYFYVNGFSPKDWSYKKDKERALNEYHFTLAPNK